MESSGGQGWSWRGVWSSWRALQVRNTIWIYSFRRFLRRWQGFAEAQEEKSIRGIIESYPEPSEEVTGDGEEQWSSQIQPHPLREMPDQASVLALNQVQKELRAGLWCCLSSSAPVQVWIYLQSLTLGILFD